MGFPGSNMRIEMPKSDLARRMILIAPVLVYLGVFFFYPIARLLMLSLFDPDVTLRHFVRAFTVPAYMRVLTRTLGIGATVTLICLVLSYPVSMLLASVSARLRTRLLFLVLIPFWTSLLVRTYAWIVILQREGLLNHFLRGLGMVDEPLALIYNRVGVLVGMTQVLLPYYIFPLVAVMMGIDRSLMQAALSLGATPLRAFLRVFLPLSFPGIAAGGLLVFILSIGFFITPALMGGYRDIMLAQVIENQVRILLNWNFAAALSVILILATLALFFMASRWFGLKRIWSGLK
jgi:ABC-type spermidine/putrescine transport system permease subunit I